MRLVCEPSVCAGGGSAAHSHVSIQQWNLPCEHPAGHERSDVRVASAVGGSREEPHGEEPSGCAGLSWLLCGVSDLGLDSTSTTIHQNARTVTSGKHSTQCVRARPPTGNAPAGARATTRARTAAKPLLGAPASGPTTRRREHPRRSSAGNTLTTYVTARLSTPTRLQNSTDRSARERARTGPRG